MIIPINLPAAGTSNSETKFAPQLANLGTDEVVLLELQGSFEVEGDAAGQVAARLKLGDDGTKPTMFIGHHLLEGKIVNLPKPLAVLVKKDGPSTSISANSTLPSNMTRANGDDAMDVEDNEKGESGRGEADARKVSEKKTEYDMLAVVKRKLMFSKRPMPVVNMVQTARTLPAK